MRILLKGYYGFGNLGDDILMIVSYKLLKEAYPTASIVVFSNNSVNNKDSKAPVGYNTYIKKLLNEDIEIIDWTYKGHFDLIFHGGGGTFFDTSYGSTFNGILNRLGYRLGPKQINNTEWFLRKILFKQPNITSNRRIGVGLGIGPFANNGTNLLRVISELASFDKIMVRDEISVKTLLDIGYTGEVQHGADLAFLTSFWIDKAKIKPRNHNLKKVAIILKGKWSEVHSYYKGLAVELLALGYKVEFFAFDEIFDREYISSLRDEFIVNIWNPHNSDFITYLNKLWDCSACVTDRAHGAILAGIGDVIPMIIKTTEKSDQIFSLLGVSQLIPSFKYKTKYTFSEVTKVLSNKDEISHRLRKKVLNNYDQLNTSLENML